MTRIRPIRPNEQDLRDAGYVQAVFEIGPANMWYSVYHRRHSTTYSAQVCGLSSYMYCGGFANKEAAQEWAKDMIREQAKKYRTGTEFEDAAR